MNRSRLADFHRPTTIEMLRAWHTSDTWALAEMLQAFDAVADRHGIDRENFMERVALEEDVSSPLTVEVSAEIKRARGLQ